MKIECENCQAIYKIDKSKIPAKGKKVKCTHCGNIWVHIPENIYDNSQLNNIEKKPNNNHTDLKKTLYSNIKLIITIIPLIFLFSTTFQSNIPYNIRKIYRLTETYDTSNIKLTSSNIKISKIDNKTVNVKIDGVIENQSNKERFIPDIYFIFYSKDKKVILSKKLRDNKYGIIPGNAKYNFTKNIYSISNNIDTLQIKIGNMFEVYLY
ncbi:zinc-ribbon domain-containing protein [Neoehrlichia mikurensis]|uniref:Zinc-ribbon domain-containing protein n=1 Tax=Neoehrlichia mikurensis TaxID=89586 RepID=A0A9Q9BZR9_9RICK|nr:zinc-ribbon domain-containing protein [Neoehrlichia mikurensis]QXK92299.1 zinc-ribbon domain-containing protein [Neoehrlichia mikurensis]QXK92753.1 zinc-ribbon domain-containing protein [Neoehrlichia mikurensis]QXK93994.1 zinc-ribbon domain-containing protein [Neoehrlichia mikurensis]UTO55843.1 zinc-ribbon domain-containing protein [Neoehrlichia mikurensis]UTO56758.1 zinc-ribbon domain-containing protein [Neoehrlichia mikurensis]